MWKYISGVPKVVEEKKKEKNPKAAWSDGGGGGGGGGGKTFGRVKTYPGECILRVTRPNGECSEN